MNFKLKEGKRFKKEKRKEIPIKKIIITLLIIVIFVIIAVIFYFNKDKNNVIINENIESANNTTSENKNKSKNTIENVDLSKEMVKEKQYKNTKITNIKLSSDEQGISYFECKIKNEANEILKKQDVYFVFLNENNTELTRFKYRLPELKQEEEKKVTIVTTTNITNSNDFRIEEYK